MEAHEHECTRCGGIWGHDDPNCEVGYDTPYRYDCPDCVERADYE